MASLRLKKEDVGAFTQLYVLLSVIIFIVSQQSLFFASFFISPTNVLSSEPFSLANPWHYLRLFFHPFGHHSVLALCANAAFLFFLSPLVEKKYTKSILLGMFFTCALVSASLTVAFFPNPIQGGTGFTFLYLLLCLIDSLEKQEFSFSLCIILILFLIRVFYEAVDEQDLSAFMHLVGSLVASILAFIHTKKPIRRKPVAKKEMKTKNKP